jgi:hypothetical protein
MLANAAALDAVNDWLAEAGEEPVPMTRSAPTWWWAGAPAWGRGRLASAAGSGSARCRSGWSSRAPGAW